MKLLMISALLWLLIAAVGGAVATLEERVATLEKEMVVCCSTELRNVGAEQDLEYMVRLRREIAELRTRLEVLENAK